MQGRRKAPADDTAPIFARIPRAEADKLERLSFQLQRPKREIIAGLLARYTPEDEASEEAERWTLGRAAFGSAGAGEILTLEQLAQFLQLDEETARALAEAGQLPGRKIGDEWRFSRRAVLSWLEGGG